MVKLKKDEYKHFWDIGYEQAGSEPGEQRQHDEANCGYCNPTVKLKLMPKEIRKVKEYCDKEGIDSGILKDGVIEIDDITYDTYVHNNDLIAMSPAIEDWREAKEKAIKDGEAEAENLEQEMQIELKKEVYNQGCDKCHSFSSQKTGKRTYVTGIYQMRRCIACGHQYKAERIKAHEVV